MVTEMDKILPAIAQAMSAIKGVAKGSRNVEQKYDFASIDNFLEMANPICAENGIIIHMDEVSREEFTRAGKYGDTFWVLIGFSIVVFHASGQSLPPVRRSVEVIRSGAQAYGSAQSYCLKQFLRALFLIPTGDKDDADYSPVGDGAPAKRAESPRRDATKEAIAYLSDATDLADLKARWSNLPSDVQATGPVTAAKDARKAFLMQAPVSADLGGDSIPY